MSLKKLSQIFILSLGGLGVSSVYADERSDINQMLKEIQYLKEVTAKLKKQYEKPKCTRKVCFQYQGLLEQLQAAESGIEEYMNLDIQTLHTTPVKPLNTTLYRVRKN